MVRSPNRLMPYEDESLVSYIHRFAEANYLDSANDLKLTNTRDFYKSFGEEKFINKTIELTGLGEELLKSLTIERYKNVIAIEGPVSEKVKMRYLEKRANRVCPKCLKEKYYQRLSWQLITKNICTKHNVYLINHCKNCGKEISLLSALSGCCTNCGISLTSMATEEVKDANEIKMQYLLDSLLDNNNCGFENENPLNSLTPSYMLLLITTLTEISRRYPTNRFGVETGEQLKSALKKGIDCKLIATLYPKSFEILQNWPHNYWEFLDQFRNFRQDINRKLGNLTKDFNRLMYFLKKDFPYPQFQFLRDGFLQFLCNEPDRYRISQKIYKTFSMEESKDYFSKKEAMQLLKVGGKRFKEAMHKLNISFYITRADCMVNYLISKHDFERIKNLLKKIASNPFFIEVEELLNISEDTVKHLVQLGLLRTCIGLNRYELIEKEGFKSFMHTFFSNRNLDPKITWITFRQAIRKLCPRGNRIGQILCWMKEGKIVFGHDINSKEKGLYSLVVSEESIEDLKSSYNLQIYNEKGYSLYEAACKFLKTSLKTLKNWIAEGLINVEETYIRGKKSFVFKKAEIERFLQVYVSANDISILYGINRNTFNSYITRGLIKPVSGSSVGSMGRNLFRKEDVEIFLKKIGFKSDQLRY